MARIEREARRLDEVERWWDFPVLGGLVATAAFSFYIAGGNAETALPPVTAAVGAAVTGIVAALYNRYRDRKESREVLAVG